MTVTLHLGDCLEYMRTMPDKSVDAVITDPPYGLGIVKNTFRHKPEFEDKSQTWDDKPASKEQIAEALRVSGTQIIWGGNYFHLPPSRCFLVWDKKQSEAFSSSMCEMAWTNMDKPAKMFSRSVTSYEKFHPTTKPLDLMLWVIRNYTNEGDTIFDPFMGSGTTGVAAVQLGRNFIGCEINPDYFATAEKRIRQAQEARQLEFA